jgi:arylsulfatase A-like enzyme
MTKIAVVVLDTLRKDSFDKHFDWLPGVRYENAWSPSHRTPPVHASLFCGKYPSELGFGGGSNALRCEDPTLAERLAERGYETVGFSANPYITSHFDFDRGFQSFELPWQLDGLSDDIFDWRSAAGELSKEGLAMYLELFGQLMSTSKKVIPSVEYGLRLFLNNRDLWGVNDSGIVEATEFVANYDFADESFLFMNLMEAHEPYVPPESFRTTGVTDHAATVEISFESTDLGADRLRGAYDDSVRYLSERYRETFDVLSDEFDYVVTCADHGELFGRDGLWGHFFGVYPELTNVPLVVWNGESRARISETVVSLLDVHRTVLNVAGVDGQSRGTSLREEHEGGTYLSQCFGISDDRLANFGENSDAASTSKRYASSLTAMASPEDYYQYETVEGLVESGSSVHDDPRAVRRELENELTQYADRSEEALSGSVESRLEELGYL